MRKSKLVLAAVLAAAAATVTAVPPAKAQMLERMISEVSPTTFVQQAAVSDQFEIETSRLALQRSNHPQIRELAEMLIRDHTASANELMALPEGSTRISGGLDESHQRKLVQLTGYHGDEFNRWYVQMQVEAHEEAVRLFQAYAENGQVPVLKAFAQKHLPRLQLHQQQARSLQVQPAAR
jgi:putative membrane protein